MEKEPAVSRYLRKIVIFVTDIILLYLDYDADVCLLKTVYSCAVPGRLCCEGVTLPGKQHYSLLLKP